ncbi:MAG: hypothetical protein C0478_07400 [Planctomyces sp.]|nr:hypothetical protein [Planctomyces sp.]
MTLVAALAALILIVAVAVNVPSQWRLLGLYWPIVAGTCVLLSRWFEIALDRSNHRSSHHDVKVSPELPGVSSSMISRGRLWWLHALILGVLTVTTGIMVDTVRQPHKTPPLNPFRGAEPTPEQRAVMGKEFEDFFQPLPETKTLSGFFLHSFPDYLMMRMGTSSIVWGVLLFIWEVVAAGALGVYVASAHEQQLAYEEKLRWQEAEAGKQSAPLTTTTETSPTVSTSSASGHIEPATASQTANRDAS